MPPPIPAAPAAYPNLPYDAAKDFAGVALFGSVPNVLLVAPSKGIKTIAEFVAKAKDGNMTFASAGVGSATHWAAERFRVSAGIKATHVPFRGGPEALTEVMTGRVDFIFIGISSGLPFIKNDQLLPLAVSSAKRSPRCRTCRPRSKPATRIPTSTTGTACWCRRRHRARSSTDCTRKPRRRWRCRRCRPSSRAQGVEPAPLTPTEMDAMIAREIALNLKIAKAAGLKFN